MAYDAYADAIFRYCRLKVSGNEVAQDITAETFTRFWQQLRLGKEIPNERALLYRIARNLVIDWYRKKKDQSLDTLTDAGFEFPNESHIDAQMESEFKEAVAVIKTLDEPTKDALLLRFVEGLSPKDIAQITGESANVISVRITRGLAKVKGRLHIP